MIFSYDFIVKQMKHKFGNVFQTTSTLKSTVNILTYFHIYYDLREVQVLSAGLLFCTTGMKLKNERHQTAHLIDWSVHGKSRVVQ